MTLNCICSECNFQLTSFIILCYNISMLCHRYSESLLILLCYATGIQNPYGLAIDWISQNLYISSYSGRGASIAISKLDGAYRSLLNVSSDFLVEPNSLAVHPVKALVFILWSFKADDNIFNIYNALWNQSGIMCILRSQFVLSAVRVSQLLFDYYELTLLSVMC